MAVGVDQVAVTHAHAMHGDVELERLDMHPGVAGPDQPASSWKSVAIMSRSRIEPLVMQPSTPSPCERPC